MAGDPEEERQQSTRLDLQVRLIRLLRVREELQEEGLPIPAELEEQIRKVWEAIGSEGP